MEYDIWKAFLFFFCGALTYASALRIFKMYSKTLFYKVTFINCLSVLKFADQISQELLNSSDEADEETIKKALGHWRTLSLLSLRTYLPDHVWRQLAITDWATAMKLLSNLEKKEF